MLGSVLFFFLAFVPVCRTQREYYEADGDIDRADSYERYNEEIKAPLQYTTVMDGLTRLKRWGIDDMRTVNQEEPIVDVKGVLNNIFHGDESDALRGPRNPQQHTDSYVYAYAENAGPDRGNRVDFTTQQGPVQFQQWMPSIGVQGRSSSDEKQESTVKSFSPSRTQKHWSFVYHPDTTTDNKNDIVAEVKKLLPIREEEVPRRSSVETWATTEGTEDTEDPNNYPQESTVYNPSEMQAAVKKLIQPWSTTNDEMEPQESSTFIPSEMQEAVRKLVYRWSPNSKSHEESSSYDSAVMRTAVKKLVQNWSSNSSVQDMSSSSRLLHISYTSNVQHWNPSMTKSPVPKIIQQKAGMQAVMKEFKPNITRSKLGHRPVGFLHLDSSEDDQFHERRPRPFSVVPNLETSVDYPQRSYAVKLFSRVMDAGDWNSISSDNKENLAFTSSDDYEDNTNKHIIRQDGKEEAKKDDKEEPKGDDKDAASGGDKEAAGGGGKEAASGGDKDAAGGGDKEAAGGGGKEAASGGDKDAAGGGDKEAAGGGGKEAASGGDKDAAGGGDKEAASGGDKDAAGGGDKEAAGGGGKEAAGGGGKEAASGGDKDAAGGGDKEAASGGDKDAAGGGGKEAASGGDKDAASGGDKDAASGGDKAAASGGDKEAAGGDGKEVAGGDGKEATSGGDKDAAGGGDKEAAGGDGKEATSGGDKVAASGGDKEGGKGDDKGDKKGDDKGDKKGDKKGGKKEDKKNKTTKKTTTKTTTTTAVTTTQSTKQPIDIDEIMAIISNLTYDYEWNLTEQFNKSVIDHGVPTCPWKGGGKWGPGGAWTATTTTTMIYDFENASVVSKCFVCGLKDEEIPRDAYCADAFAGDFLPLMPIDARSRGKIAGFRKYCRYIDVQNYVENPLDARAIYGRFSGGCAVRWTDLTGVYTQRTCRSKYRPLLGKHIASKRMAKLELALVNVENGCIISPMATLLPVSRGISLYARFHACVCTSNWCNRAIFIRISTTTIVAYVLVHCLLHIWPS